MYLDGIYGEFQKINRHFRPPVGAVSNRTASALLETVPTKRENAAL